MQNGLFPQTDGGSSPTSPLQLTLKLVEKHTASSCYKRWHYFGDKGFLSTYNFGVYYGQDILGCISYGIPNARNIKGLYNERTQGNFLELSRFALSQKCPKNSESRVISISIKLIKKLSTVTKGIITYADTAYNHTGIIYKASNFLYLGLTAQKTDLFLNGVPVGKLKNVKYSDIDGQWVKRSRKHLFVRLFNNENQQS